MHWQVLGSGSEGNAILVRAGEQCVLLDCGLSGRETAKRLQAAGLPSLAARSIDHVAITHGHLDHARSAGMVGRATRAPVHAPERCLQNRSLRGARDRRALVLQEPLDLGPDALREDLEIVPVLVPHDADPTVAYRVRHGARVAVTITDMGAPCAEAAGHLQGAHLLQLEFNHDAGLLANGPYSPALKRRVSGDHGHLSNEQAASMLRLVAGAELHTLVLAHLSKVNNRPLLALEAARATLEDMGLGHVRVLVASQDEVGPNLAV